MPLAPSLPEEAQTQQLTRLPGQMSAMGSPTATFRTRTRSTVAERKHADQRTKENLMVDTVIETLILDLLDWLASAERTYEEVMDAWRTSCPKLPVWEDANDRGLVETEQVGGRSVVKATPSGLALLERQQKRP